MTTIKVAVSGVKIPPSHRTPLRGRVASMARSLQTLGQLAPIGINQRGELVYGRHRLEAAISIGWKQIEAKLVDFDDLRAELATIDENIERAGLNAMEEAKALARRKEIYEAMHPTTKHGGTPGGDGSGKPPLKGSKDATVASLPSFAQDTAEKTGQSQRSVQRKTMIGEMITPSAEELIKGTPTANSTTELEKLAKLPEDQQVRVAVAIHRGEATTVDQAKTPKSRSGQMKRDPRLWLEITGLLGKALNRIDALNRDYPHANLHRTAISQVKDAMKTLEQWKAASAAKGTRPAQAGGPDT